MDEYWKSERDSRTGWGFVNIILGSGFVSGYATWGCTLIFLDLCFLTCHKSGVLSPGCTLKSPGNLKEEKKPMSEPLYSPGVSKSLGVGPGNFLLNFLSVWEFFNAASIENLRIRIILIAHFCPKMLWFCLLYPTMLFLSDTVHKML